MDVLQKDLLNTEDCKKIKNFNPIHKMNLENLNYQRNSICARFRQNNLQSIEILQRNF